MKEALERARKERQQKVYFIVWFFAGKKNWSPNMSSII